MEIRYYGDKISERIAKTPEGFLICQDVPISRTGYQKYLKSELTDNPVGDDKIIHVYRPSEEVFDLRSLASFEGKPVTNEHPDEDVTPKNYQRYSCGHVQNVHAGEGEDSNKVLADLYITDPLLISLIEEGKREISCGYYAEEKRDSSGRICQTKIRGNHVAVVSNGRAGNKVCIRDKKPLIGRKFEMKKHSLSHYIDGLKYLDDDELVRIDECQDDDIYDDDILEDDDIYDDDIYEDDDILEDDDIYDDDIYEDDDILEDDDIYDDDILEDDDVYDDDSLEDDDILEDDDVYDDDILEDDDFEDDDFEDDDILEDDDCLSDDDILKEKANAILNDAKRTLRDARIQLKRCKLNDAIIVNDDEFDDDDILEDDEILEDDDFEDDDILEDDDFEDDDFEDDDILEDDDFEDDDLLEDDDFEDDDIEDDDILEDDEFEDDEILEDDDFEDDDLLEDDDFEDDDIEVTDTDELANSEEATIDTDKTAALREITEASRGITDPNERKHLQDAIYKALCGKTQMTDVMNITKKNRKARMDSMNNGSVVSLDRQQSIYDSFNPHKKTSF